MAICTAFADSLECTISLTNSYNIKLTVLTILLVYSIVIYYLSKNIDKEKSYMHYWGFWFAKVIPIIYFFFAPLAYMLLLNINITLEIFYTIIAGFYLVASAILIGVVVYGGGTSIFQIFGFDDWNELKDARKAKKSERKYG